MSREHQARKFDFLCSFSFATGKQPKLEQYLQSVVDTSGEKVWASIVVDPEKPEVTHFNLMAAKPARKLFEDTLWGIDRKLHELQPQEKRILDGMCKGTGKEMRIEHWFHTHTHQPAANEIYYEEKVGSVAKLHGKIRYITEGDFHKIERRLKEAAHRLNPHGDSALAIVTLEHDLRPTVQRNEYEIRFVSLPPPKLRGEYHEDDERYAQQREALQGNVGKPLLEEEFRKIKSALESFRDNFGSASMVSGVPLSSKNDFASAAPSTSLLPPLTSRTVANPILSRTSGLSSAKCSSTASGSSASTVTSLSPL
jgi:hypothetical protein